MKANLSSHIENYERMDGSLNLVEWKEELHRAIQNAHRQGNIVKSAEEMMRPKPINYEELKEQVAEVIIASFTGQTRSISLEAYISLESDVVSYAVSPSKGPTFITAFFKTAVAKYNELLLENNLTDVITEEVVDLDYETDTEG